MASVTDLAPTSPALQHRGPCMGPMNPDYSTAAGQPPWAFPPGSPTGPPLQQPWSQEQQEQQQQQQAQQQHHQQQPWSPPLSPNATWSGSTPPLPQAMPSFDLVTVTPQGLDVTPLRQDMP